MFLFSVCHVAVRSLGVALLAVVSPLLVAAFFGADIFFLFAFKAIRNDLRYWLKLDKFLSWFGSFLIRLLTKLMVDFTGLVHLRHPNEMGKKTRAKRFFSSILLSCTNSSPLNHFFDFEGGVYWIICLLSGQSTSFVAVYLFYMVQEETVDSRFIFGSLWSLLLALEASFVVSFTIFVLSMKKIYISTFFTTMTAKQFNIRRYREATSDRARLAIFGKHSSYYESIRGELKAWVTENYKNWDEENPEWFTDRIKASVPLDMIPKNDDADEIQEEKMGERRGSAAVIKEALGMTAEGETIPVV